MLHYPLRLQFESLVAGRDIVRFYCRGLFLVTNFVFAGLVLTSRKGGWGGGMLESVERDTVARIECEPFWAAALLGGFTWFTASPPKNAALTLPMLKLSCHSLQLPNFHMYSQILKTPVDADARTCFYCIDIGHGSSCLLSPRSPGSIRSIASIAQATATAEASRKQVPEIPQSTPPENSTSQDAMDITADSCSLLQE